jgi:hypothetical protein
MVLASCADGSTSVEPDASLDVVAFADAATPGLDGAGGAGELPPSDRTEDICSEGGGCFGDPCEDAANCYSGLCAEHMGESVCTKTCDEDCPTGWSCEQVNDGADPIYMCVSNVEHLCRPCLSAEDCTSISNEAVCVTYGAEGSFCGAVCEIDSDCPTGFVCQESISDRGGASSQCVDEDGVCECSTRSSSLGLVTQCSITNDLGTCSGHRQCLDSGLSACDASEPHDELCNGLDDDCDAETDEGLGESSCGDGACAQTIANCAEGLSQFCEPYLGASAETCNGIDDDCDSATDEDQGEIACGVGACTHSLASCLDGVTSSCDPLEGAADELCDDLDNDCDGETDESLEALVCGLGVCQHSVVACVAGESQTCDPLEGAQDETCDGLDDDCDGETDEDQVTPTCVDGLVQVCNPFQGAVAELCNGVDDDCDSETDESLGESTCGSGVCHHTVTHCEEGVSQQCDPYEGATEELCNGLDDDCDSTTDEDQGETTCGAGVCEHTVPSCTQGAATTCDPLQGAKTETCNGLDDDCDSETDEALEEITCGEGICTHTIASCLGGALQFCNPYDGAAPETCNGIDDDCDGATDEGQGTVDCGEGVCAHTVDNCLTGELQTCDPFEGQDPEVCNGLDDDCDGLTDEDQGELACGVGQCEHTIPTCVGGEVQLCDSFEGTVPEVCDGLDNDCDGETDEGLGETQCGTGACDHSVTACVNGQLQPCDPFEGVTADTCDGIDNNCDGATDEDLGQTQCGAGTCVHSVDNCVDGVVQVCDPFEGATEDLCDGVDNDCDSLTDEGLGETLCGEGACVHSVDNCIGGEVQVCDPFEGVSDDICDGVDNDCDSLTDEDLGQTECGEGPCLHSVEYCVAGVVQDCDPFLGASPDTCDGVDNDCDSLTDEDLGVTQCGVGACEHDVANCIGGVVQTCDPFLGATDDICDGIDNDCNGGTDEGCPTLGEQVTDPGFDSVSGQVCGAPEYAGPIDIGGSWNAFVVDTHPSNGYGCGSMCAGASDATGYAGGANGAGCNSWVYQCMTIPSYSTITLSYDYMTSSNYGGTVHRVVVGGGCSEGPPSGANWRPYTGDQLFYNPAKPGGWTHFEHDLTTELAEHQGQTIMVGLYTNNSWASAYYPKSYIDNVHLVAE